MDCRTACPQLDGIPLLERRAAARGWKTALPHVGDGPSRHGHWDSANPTNGLDGNQLTTLPAGVFDGPTSLHVLSLNKTS